MDYPENLFLSYLKQEPVNVLNLIANEILPPDRLEKVDLIRAEAIKIIETGIFYQGGLKGASHGDGVNFDKIALKSNINELIINLSIVSKFMIDMGNRHDKFFFECRGPTECR